MCLDPHCPDFIPDSSQMLASIPAILGYYPADELVIMHVHETMVINSLGTDLRTFDDAPDLIDRIGQALVHAEDRGWLVLVIIGGDDGGRGALPRTDLVDRLRSATAPLPNLRVVAFWTPTISATAKWKSHNCPDVVGTLPDPTTTKAAAIAVARGLTIVPTRDAARAVVAPDPQEALRRRAAILDTISTLDEQGQWQPNNPDCVKPDRHDTLLSLVLHHVRGTGGRDNALTDIEVAELALALSDRWVRDIVVGYALTEQAANAERLWTELTRACPMPEGAEPAVLLAVSAYLRGDGTLAHMALDRAAHQNPSHRLARLLRTLMLSATPPSVLREAVMGTVACAQTDHPART